MGQWNPNVSMPGRFPRAIITIRPCSFAKAKPLKLSISKDLGKLRADGLVRLDRAMKLRRNALLDFNSDIHAAKRAEAQAVLLGGTEAPLLAAEASATGRTLMAVAETVLAKSAAALPAVAGLEAERQRRQVLIRAAKTPAEIDAALDGVEGA